MRLRTRIISAALLIAAVLTMAFGLREYRRARNYSQLQYTQANLDRDLVNSEHDALASLTNAELREQNYTLTGETVYLEAYSDAIRKWDDESGTLELLGAKGNAGALIRDFSKAGRKTLDEIAAIISTYDHDSADRALQRIKKGAGIVYLDQAREIASALDPILQQRLESATRALTLSEAVAYRRLTLCALLLPGLAFCLALVYFLEARFAGNPPLDSLRKKAALH